MRSVVFWAVLIIMSLMACHARNMAATAEQTNIEHARTVIYDSTAAKSEDINWDTVKYDHIYFPIDSDYPARVLTTGEFHGGEVWEQADTERWWGLFKNKSDYYLAKTDVSIAHANDPIVDTSDKQESGWLVSTVDTAVILFSELPGLAKHHLNALALPTNGYVWPGDTFTMRYKGKTMMLYATGGKHHEKNVQNDWYDVWNYKLYITVTTNKGTTTELLVATSWNKEAMTQIIFAGDIDGDGIPDFIIDTTNHYNASIPTLYLSKYAEGDHIYKVVGMHISVGC